MHLNPVHQSVKSCVRYLCRALARLQISSLSFALCWTVLNALFTRTAISYRRIRRYLVWRLKRLEARDFSRVRIKFLIHIKSLIKSCFKIWSKTTFGQRIISCRLVSNITKQHWNFEQNNTKKHNISAQNIRWK